ADIVVFDPKFEMELSQNNLHSRIDYSIYEGFKVKGMPIHVFVRGKPVIQNREFVGKKGTGKFIPRGKYQPLT
ncbi:MAG: dihydropyrimidinase, partial [Candidatus Methanomethylicaceae archaeon]